MKMNNKDLIYVASCVFTREYPELSKAMQHYVRERFGVPIMRCCVKNYKTQEFEDSMPDWFLPEWKSLPAYIDMNKDKVMAYVCHNCSAIFQEQMPNVQILSLWELILNDDTFVFPDFSHEKMTVQDCWRSRDNRAEQDTVRALLRKMNIEIIEQKANHENTDFCGTSLYAPAPARNLKLAPKRFVENAIGKFVPHSEEEKKKLMEEHCMNIVTEKVVAYCHYCVEGLNLGGKKGLHLAELLF
jgi:hypothetical protein